MIAAFEHVDLHDDVGVRKFTEFIIGVAIFSMSEIGVKKHSIPGFYLIR